MKDKSDFDLVVVGATPGGISCAVAAARAGLSVLLTNWNEHPGGFFVNGGAVLDTVYEGNRAPLFTEFVERIQEFNKRRHGEDSAHYRETFYGDRLNSNARPRIRNEAAAAVFGEWIRSEANITLVAGVYPAAVERTGRQLQAVFLEKFGNSERRRYSGKVFVDATYEGDLAAVAGVKYRVGRESRAEYGELHAGKVFTWRGEDGHFPREAAEGLINTRIFRLTNKQIFAGSTGEGDRAIQAYNFRMQLTDDPERRRPITRPDNYDRERYAGITGGEQTRLKKTFPIKSDGLYNGVERVGMHGQYHCFPGGNHDYPEAGWEERRAILKAHTEHTLGYYYFLQNDESVPEAIRERNRQIGLDKTLYPDNDNFPYEIYVREARRICGRYVFREQDATYAEGYGRAPVHSDSVGVTEWPMDSHDCTPEMVPGSLHDGVLLLTEETRPGQIPYRSLLPRDLDNLIVPTCLSATHVAWGTVRLEPVWMPMGEVAAHAAALSLHLGTTPGELDAEQLQMRLVENGIMVSFFNEFDMGTDEPWVPAVQYLGAQGFFSSYNAQPEEHLTPSVARIWARACAVLGNGHGIAAEVARSVQQATNSEDGGITGKVWLQLLERAATAEGLAFGSVRSLNEEIQVSAQDMVLRGEACRLIYALVRAAKQEREMQKND